MIFFSARSRSRYCSVRIVAVNSPGRNASFVLERRLRLLLRQQLASYGEGLGDAGLCYALR